MKHGPVKVVFSKDPNMQAISDLSQPDQKQSRRAFELRNRAPQCEKILRCALRVFEAHGCQFYHSVPLHGYIADFYCPSRRLIIELDGPVHRNRVQHDRVRTRVLREAGITTARFASARVHHGLLALVDDIASLLDLPLVSRDQLAAFCLPQWLPE